MSLFEELKRRNVFRVGIAWILMGWVVLQGADFVLDLVGAPDWVIRAMAVIGVAGLPIALFFAWAFEVTPEGIKRESEVDRSRSITSHTGRKLDRAIILFLMLVIVLMAIERMYGPAEPVAPEMAQKGPVPVLQEATGPGPAAAERSIAVLPFVNMSSDPEQEYFSDGISEEILNVLSAIPDLRVAARTSSFKFKGMNEDIADIARQLRVSHVLEGSVRKAGSQLRITAQLIEAESGFHLWSETYDRRLEDVFAIQDEISAAIASELQRALSGEDLAESTPVDLVAYELYLKGRGLIATRRAQQLEEAIETLQAAIAIAPDYAPAQSSLALAYAVLPWFSGAIPTGQAREQSRRWAMSALALDASNEDALAALSTVLRESDLDTQGALAMLQRALEINPGNATVHNFLGDLYTRSWALDLALVHEARAAELDPLGPVQVSDLSQVYLLMGDYTRAVEFAERALELSPGFGNALTVISNAGFSLGDTALIERAIGLGEAAGTRDNVLDRLRLHLHMSRGELEAARQVLQRAVARTEGGKGSYTDAATSAVAFGDFDTAGRMLLKGLAAQDGTWTFPFGVRLPEQAPDSEPWQAFWSEPGPRRLAAERRANGMSPSAPRFGEAAP